MSAKKPPPTERCHCTAGVGKPDAVAVKVTDTPGLTDWSAGWVVTAGACLTFTVSVWVAFGFTPLDAVKLNGKDPATDGVPPRVAVPSPLSTKVSPDGNTPVREITGVGVPVVVTVNEPAAPTKKDTVFVLVMTGAWLTFTVSVCVAFGLTPLLAVIVIGKDPATDGVPARVAVPLPLSVKLTPTGRAPVLVRVVAAGYPAVVVTVKLPALPLVNVAELALVITGEALAGFTVSVNACWEVPAVLLAPRVNE
jgi:hypothetical protein